MINLLTPKNISVIGYIILKKKYRKIKHIVYMNKNMYETRKLLPLSFFTCNLKIAVLFRETTKNPSSIINIYIYEYR